MIKRQMFFAQLKEINNEALDFFDSFNSRLLKHKDERLMTLSLFIDGLMLYLYFESIDEAVQPGDLFPGCEELLENFPLGEKRRVWVPMTDIFHYNNPVSIEHWRRKTNVTRRYLRIARLKPEMISSYIYYHYQYQEESPGTGDKYGIIYLIENIICFYQEEPWVIEPSIAEGKLISSNSPTNWMEVMTPHFIFWENALESQKIWRDIDHIL